MTDSIRIRAALKRLVDAIDELVGNSVGVAKLRNIELAIWPELLVGWQWRWLGDAIDQAREALADQVVPLINCNARTDRGRQRTFLRNDILTIAAQLRGSNSTHTHAG